MGILYIYDINRGVTRGIQGLGKMDAHCYRSGYIVYDIHYLPPAASLLFLLELSSLLLLLSISAIRRRDAARVHII